jgi:hypothetical protein
MICREGKKDGKRLLKRLIALPAKTLNHPLLQNWRMFYLFFMTLHLLFALV